MEFYVKKCRAQKAADNHNAWSFGKNPISMAVSTVVSIAARVPPHEPVAIPNVYGWKMCVTTHFNNTYPSTTVRLESNATYSCHLDAESLHWKNKWLVAQAPTKKVGECFCRRRLRRPSRRLSNSMSIVVGVLVAMVVVVLLLVVMVLTCGFDGVSLHAATQSSI